MTLRPSILFALILAVAGLSIAAGARRLAGAQAQCSAAETRLALAVRDANRVLDLRSRQQRAAERSRPEQDMIARVNETLGTAGIAPDRFGSVRQESDSPVPGTAGGVAYRQQTIRITLRQLKLRELGAFLADWGERQELWTPSRIDLTHARGETSPARFDVTILMSATYVAEQ